MRKLSRISQPKRSRLYFVTLVKSLQRTMVFRHMICAHLGEIPTPDVVAEMKANGESVPEPIASRRFSGRFVFRVPPEAHRKAVLEASENQVSLNRLVSSKLAG